MNQIELKQKFQAHITALGISRKKIAEILQIHHTTFSQMWNKQNGNSLKEKHLLIFENYLKNYLKTYEKI